MRHKPIWDYETGVPRSQGKMNPVDYWYKKYIALKECERIPKPELTWEDIMTIDVFINNLSAEKGTRTLKEYYEEVLRRFNEAKEQK